MAINVQIMDDVARISMSGRFHFQVHREFKSAYMPLLDRVEVRNIEIEMGKLEYMDSAALGMLMLLNERAKLVNKSITLVNPCGVVTQILEVANFAKLFPIRNAS